MSRQAATTMDRAAVAVLLAFPAGWGVLSGLFFSQPGFASPTRPTVSTTRSVGRPPVHAVSRPTMSAVQANPALGRKDLPPLWAVRGAVVGLLGSATMFAFERSAKQNRGIRLRRGDGFGSCRQLWTCNHKKQPINCKAEPLACKPTHQYWNKIYRVIMVAGNTDQVAPTQTDAEEFVRPAPWNKPSVRNAAVALGGAAACGFLPATRAMHLTAFSFWFGTNVWTTFIAGITMFRNLPRQQFGKLQASLFPKYFQVGTACSALLLFTARTLHYPLWPIAMSLAGTLANQVYYEPASSAVMFERFERQNAGFKNEERDKALKSQFNKLHGLSSLLNLVALIGLVVHGWSLCLSM